MDAVAPSSSALARASAELSMAITCSNASVCVFSQLFPMFVPSLSW
eukprot:COSAG06_NODE_1052_length_10949_cov_42.211797_10_plen_46_part_00